MERNSPTWSMMWLLRVDIYNIVTSSSAQHNIHPHEECLAFHFGGDRLLMFVCIFLLKGWNWLKIHEFQANTSPVAWQSPKGSTTNSSVTATTWKDDKLFRMSIGIFSGYTFRIRFGSANWKWSISVWVNDGGGTHFNGPIVVVCHVNPTHLFLFTIISHCRLGSIVSRFSCLISQISWMVMRAVGGISCSPNELVKCEGRIDGWFTKRPLNDKNR